MMVVVAEGKARKYSIDRLAAMIPETWRKRAKVKVGTKLYFHEDPEDPGKLVVATRDLTKL